MLNEMRLGRVSQNTATTFRALSREVQYNDDVEPTCLYTMRDFVFEENSRRLKALEGEEKWLKAKDISGRESGPESREIYPNSSTLCGLLNKVLKCHITHVVPVT